MITAVTFDFWQTLYKNRPVDIDARLRQMQADLAEASGQRATIDEIKAAVKVARETWSHTWAVEHRTLSAREWLDNMLKALELAIEPAVIQNLAVQMEESILHTPPEVVGDAPAVLAALATDYRLAVISDTGLTPGRVLRRLLDADNLSQYFTHLTFSDEVGRSKPHADAFLTTLGHLDASPAQAVHVGDLLRTDVAGAQNVGMRGVQYVGVNRDDWSMSMAHPPAEPITPDAIITTHTELLPLLARWNNTA